MRIFDLGSLPAALRPQVVRFGVSDGDPPQDVALLRRQTRLGRPASSYYAVYAAEKGQLLSRVETLELPFTGRLGRGLVLGVADVCTLPAAIGRGYATTLLEEVHRRARKAGRPWSFLWTHRTWGAHRLYERLGYRDLYAPPSAMRPTSRRRAGSLPRAYRWTTGRPADGRRLEELLAEATAGRFGFLPRSTGSLALRLAMGWRRPEDHRILWRGSKAVGYAHLTDVSGWNVTSGEVVVTEPEHHEAMLEALEREAAGRWLTFQRTSFVRDAEGLLRERGYDLLWQAHTVLMGRPLGRSSGQRESVASAFDDPRFCSHRSQIF